MCEKVSYTTSPKISNYMQTFQQLAAAFINATEELLTAVLEGQGAMHSKSCF